MKVTVHTEWNEQGGRMAVELGAIAIMIDVIRTSSTMTALLHRKAKKIIPVRNKEEAFSLKPSNPNSLLVGEIGGKKIEGFDFGNSPTEIMNANFQDKTIIMSTTNGTRVLNAAKGSSAIFVGTIANAIAVAQSAFEFASEHNVIDIILIPAGILSGHAYEDWIGAGCIAKTFLDLGYTLSKNTKEAYKDFLKIEGNLYEHIKDTRSASIVKSLGYSEDVLFCCQYSILDEVPVAYKTDLVLEPYHPRISRA